MCVLRCEKSMECGVSKNIKHCDKRHNCKGNEEFLLWGWWAESLAHSNTHARFHTTHPNSTTLLLSHAFPTHTTHQVVVGDPEVDGFRVKFIDTCGLEDPEAGDTVNYMVSLLEVDSHLEGLIEGGLRGLLDCCRRLHMLQCVSMTVSGGCE